MSNLFRSVEATEKGAAGDVGYASGTSVRVAGAAAMAGAPTGEPTRHDGKTGSGGAESARLARPGRPLTLADLAEDEARRLQRESLEGSAALKFAIRLLIVIIVLAAGATAVLLLRP